jgi:membrane protein implicated in regulation of membrane protease activity
VALFAAFISVGAVGAAAAAFVGADLPAQVLVFAAVSLGGIVIVRRPLLRYLRRMNSPAVLSGAATMLGQTAIVVDPIGGHEQRGHVRIAGEDWPAMTRDGRPVGKGASVRVAEIRGATLIVEGEAI